MTHQPVLAVGSHLVNGEPVNGYSWLYFTNFPELFQNAGASKLRVRFVNGQLDRIEGGTLTRLGQAVYTALANTGGTIAGAVPFELWSDDPNGRVRLQVHEHWGQVSREELLAMIQRIKTVIAEIIDDLHFDTAPPRA